MKLRYARHTDNLQKLIDFYSQILGLKILGNFKNHNGYDGVFLGKPDENWHLEFTISDELPKQIFDEDDLLVFYPENEEECLDILKNINQFNIEIREPKNPYWKENGILIYDPNCFGIMISKQHIK